MFTQGRQASYRRQRHRILDFPAVGYILPRIYQNDPNCNLINECVASCELTLSERKLLHSLSILNFPCKIDVTSALQLSIDIKNVKLSRLIKLKVKKYLVNSSVLLSG